MNDFTKATVLFVLCVIFSAILSFYARAVDSTNPADYYFYDDMETAGNFNTFYATGGTAIAYDTANPEYGTYDLVQPNGNDVSCNNYIKNTAFTEYGNPYCLNFGFSTDVLANGGNQEQGIMFSAWAVAVADYKTDTSAAIWSIIDGATYNSMIASQPSALQYQNITVCFTDGYNSVGNTNAIFLLNEVNYANISTMPRSSLNKICMLNRKTSTNVYYDNIRIWNYTAYGTTPPQATNQPPVMRNVTLLPNANNHTLYLYANATDDGTNVSYYYSLFKDGNSIGGGVSSSYTQGVNTMIHSFSTVGEGVYNATVTATDGSLNSTTNSSNTVEITFPTTPATVINVKADTTLVWLILFIVMLLVGIATMFSVPAITFIAGAYITIYGVTLFADTTALGLVVTAIGLIYIVMGSFSMLNAR